MRSLPGSFIILSALGVASASSGSCAHDNCYRAVLDTYKSQLSTNVQQCSSNLACTSTPPIVTSTSTATFTPTSTSTVTVTPAGVTVTATDTPTDTITVTSTVTPPPSVVSTTTTTSTISTSYITSYGNAPVNRKAKRQTKGNVSCRTNVPTYASFCSGFARYSSACSCAGVTQSTVVLTAATVTVSTTSTVPTVIVTATTTVSTPTVTNTDTLASSTVSTTITLASSTTTLTSTVTSTIPTTVTVVSPLPALCGNDGLQWAFYTDPQPARYQPDFTAFDPTVVKTETPSIYGTTDYVYFQRTSNTTVYGGPAPAVEAFIIDHRGYLFVPETGLYTFTAGAIDDISYVWTGLTAYSGWTKANVAQYGQWDFPGNHPGNATTQIPLTAGTYVPIRLLYKQGTGGAIYSYTITSPSGIVLLSPSTGSSSYVVQFSCDGSSAPAYPKYGSET